MNQTGQNDTVRDKVYEDTEGKDFIRPRRGMVRAGVESERTTEGRHLERRKGERRKEGSKEGRERVRKWVNDFAKWRP